MVDGISAFTVGVEADVSNGIPSFAIVGLPDSAVSESKQRIRSAIKNSGFSFPNKRITVNLSPANIRKRGAGLDLAIAIAILRASSQLPHSIGEECFCAELTLGGKLSPVPGLVNIALSLNNLGDRRVIVSKEQVAQCVPLENITWSPYASLTDVCNSISNHDYVTFMPSKNLFQQTKSPVDLSEVSGLRHIIRALEIAAVGRHHILLVGPPGAGKTMIAERFSSIFPPLTSSQAIEVYANHHSAGLDWTLDLMPPMRSPHHSLTVAGLIGGGISGIPGEVTLSHHGVLFLDELLEFRAHTLQALREPLTNRSIRLSRYGHFVQLPADFTLICTLNPCPCGQRGYRDCDCSEYAIKKYWSKFNGPLLDRIDMCVSVDSLSRESSGETTTSAQSQERVMLARSILNQRINRTAGPLEFSVSCDAMELVSTATSRLHLSRRASSSLIRVAQSIAALEGTEQISKVHMMEALSLRNRDSRD